METTLVLKMLKVAYPSHFKNISKEDQLLMIETWNSILINDPADKVMEAIKEWIASKPFIPTVAEIKKKLINSTPKIEQEDVWHKRFGYGRTEPIYYDDDFSENVAWKDVPKDIRERMEYHCNPKDYENYNAIARKVIEVTGNTSVKVYTSKDTEFLNGKHTTWTNEVVPLT